MCLNSPISTEREAHCAAKFKRNRQKKTASEPISGFIPGFNGMAVQFQAGRV
jgi:hypothetical protein